jgi:hypothetical protein
LVDFGVNIWPAVHGNGIARLQEGSVDSGGHPLANVENFGSVLVEEDARSVYFC